MNAPPFDDSFQAEAEPQAEKVFIRGLDSLSNKEVKAFAFEYYPSDQFLRVEWVNDSSANLVYKTAEAGLGALHALTAADNITASAIAPHQLRYAKRLSSHPLTELYIRQATSADIKKKNAYDVSRYYLMHPNEDPRERKRQNEGNRDRNRRGSDEGANYNRRRYDDRENRKRRIDDTFNASMYDEEPAAVSDADDKNHRKRVRFGGDREDLFGGRASRDSGRLRDRSASPVRRREGDGRYGFGTDEDAGFGRRRRSRSPVPARQRARDNYDREPAPSGKGDLFANRVTSSKELFPERERFATRTNADTDLFLGPKAELFPEKPTKRPELFPSPNSTQQYSDRMDTSNELFSNRLAPSSRFANRPDSMEHRKHRRTWAIDHSPRQSVDLVKGSNGFPEPPNRSLTDRVSRDSGPPSLADRISGGSAPSLADRISGGGGGGQSGLSVKGAAAAGDSDMNVRGAAGFSVRGAAGKELFGEKIQGRGAPRRRAEDMW